MSTDLWMTGIIPATILPMNESGAIDYDGYQAFIDYLISQGVSGVAVNCDSGEAMSLWDDERREVLRKTTEVVDGRVPIISGIMATFTEQARRFAGDAAEDGSDALMVFPNVHFRGDPLESSMITSFLDEIHDASQLPQVAFQLFDDLGGIDYTPEVLRDIVQRPYVKAIKDATFDARRFCINRDIVRESAPDVAVLTGNDNFIYESFILGADGALIGAGSIATALHVKTFNAVRDGQFEEAAEIAARARPLVSALFAAPIRDYRARIKHGLTVLDVIQSAAVRAPLRPVGSDMATRVEQGLVHAALL